MKLLCLPFLVAAMLLAAAPAPAEDRYGSIVFSRESGGGYAWGMAWSYDSRSSARRRAVNECSGRGGTSCSEVAWFRNACGAVAVGNKSVGWGYGPSSADAQRWAVSKCVDNGSPTCAVVMARCAK